MSNNMFPRCITQTLNALSLIFVLIVLLEEFRLLG